MEFKRDITSLESLPQVAKELLQTFKNERLFLFDAQMGTGKTTFIKELCKQLGSDDHFSSPTYSIVNEYKTPTHTIFHFDLYRLKNKEELFDIGFEDYLKHHTYCFIEWPHLAHDFLMSGSCVKVSIELDGANRFLKASNN
ncbi:MAG: tRNA (adenosine(37)-N6)-threonylcarbamoyltransferase complex ATPase subunit type 1 TsaE [Bacteroidia bacterium]|nr:tRNA (adenosine(37)-N6)-threonylcarbamoyltransferase complex ATPase subunit type 1 TsaE [Sphingobacteriaceae bacterium]MBP9068371.1 tRNA (adenosine(37)-N6)-threonylcarbamoyltransferase complex ATPase subunit type 1 TsaE [Bacteroidia bacterium]